MVEESEIRPGRCVIARDASWEIIEEADWRSDLGYWCWHCRNMNPCCLQCDELKTLDVLDMVEIFDAPCGAGEGI